MAESPRPEGKASQLVCIHGVPLADSCDTCDGKAEDGGFGGEGWRIVDPTTVTGDQRPQRD